jgi:bifunctional DNase/RNase
MEKLKLDIVGLSYSQTQSGAYALVLAESKGNRRLPIIIGGFEAQAIAIELEKMKPSRPLTHDLFKHLATEFNIKVHEVIIYNLVEGIFYARLVCEQEGRVVEIDARTSDAIALAVRFECAIYTYEFILSSAGIMLDDEEKEGTEISGSDDDAQLELSEIADDLSVFSETDLQDQLNEALANEDYEQASKIRDEIKKRKGK